MRDRSVRKPHGFTIVELLIVIVVIAILAAITIVAYTGISQRAIAASLQSDLDNASKQLKLYQVDNSGYPLTNDCSTSPAANSICLKSSSSNRYTTYLPVNNINPQTFCLTATNSSTDYFINNDNTSQSGSCYITNLIPNPSLEANTTGWSYTFGTGGTGTIEMKTDGGYSGNSYYRMTWTATPSVSWGGSMAYTVTVEPGRTYTVSAWVRTPRAQPFRLFLRANGFPSNADVGGPIVSVPSNTWTRLSATVNSVPSGVTLLTANMQRSGSGSWVSGDILDTDAVIFTQGPTVYNYADGNSPGWTWNSIVNSSTSTGPSL